jgi:hypothetical protein
MNIQRAAQKSQSIWRQLFGHQDFRTRRSKKRHGKIDLIQLRGKTKSRFSLKSIVLLPAAGAPSHFFPSVQSSSLRNIRTSGDRTRGTTTMIGDDRLQGTPRTTFVGSQSDYATASLLDFDCPSCPRTPCSTTYVNIKWFL